VGFVVGVDVVVVGVVVVVVRVVVLEIGALGGLEDTSSSYSYSYSYCGGSVVAVVLTGVVVKGVLEIYCDLSVTLCDLGGRDVVLIGLGVVVLVLVLVLVVLTSVGPTCPFVVVAELCRKFLLINLCLEESVVTTGLLVGLGLGVVFGSSG
jgi:hypothetical protein